MRRLSLILGVVLLTSPISAQAQTETASFTTFITGTPLAGPLSTVDLFPLIQGTATGAPCPAGADPCTKHMPASNLLYAPNNLSDLVSTATARTNLLAGTPTGTLASCLGYNNTGGVIVGSCGTGTGGGGGVPGGTPGQIQSNSAGAFGGFTVNGDFIINTNTGLGTLATVNSTVGTYAAVTIDAKGRATAGANLTGDITTSGNTATLNSTGVTPGSYTNSNLTVNAKGLVTAVSNGSGGASGISGLTTGQLGVAGSSTTLNSSIPFGTSGISTIVQTDGSGKLVSGLLPNTPVSAGSYTNANITVGSDGRLTSAANGSGAAAGNPTATIGVAAVNGTATTLMRSDAAPAIPQCSATTFGACKADGTTITASGGVLSAVGGGGGGGLTGVQAGSPSILINTTATPCTAANPCISTTAVTRSQAGGAIAASDAGKIVYNTGGGGITLPPHGTTGFGAGFATDILTDATPATITVTSDTINGNATEVLGIKQGVSVLSDGTNYKATLGMPEPVANSVLVAGAGRQPQWQAGTASQVVLGNGALAPLPTGGGGSGPTSPVFFAPGGGGADSDYTPVQTALDAGKTVVMSGGMFNMCHGLKVHQSGVLIMMQANTVEDRGFAPSTKKPSTWVQCVGGTFVGTSHVAADGHYAYIAGVAVIAALDDAGANCFEILNNASFTIFRDLWTYGCMGNGFSVNADPTLMGAQNTNGLLIRPHLINVALENNGKYGISCSNVNGVAAVTDFVVEFGDIGGNGQLAGGGGVFLDVHCGGQQVWSNTKIDFNGGPCMVMGDVYAQFTNMWCDSNSSNLVITQDNTANGSMVAIANWSFHCPTGGTLPAITMHGNLLVNMQGIMTVQSCPSLFKTDGTLHPESVISISSGSTPAYGDTYSATTIEPFIVAPAKAYGIVALSGTTYNWTMDLGRRNFEVDLTSACGSLPTGCTLANPSSVPSGLGGVFLFRQDGTGNRGISSWGTNFLVSTLPTLSTSAAAQDLVPYITDNAGKIVFLAPQLNAH